MKERMLEAVARRPRTVIAVALALALAGGAYAVVSLRPSAATDTLVPRSSATYAATQAFYGGFGGESIVVMIRGPLDRWLFSPDLERELGLEGCISGHMPAAAIARHGGPGGPCGQLRRLAAVKLVLGPGTFINESALQITDALGTLQRTAQQSANRAAAAIRAAALKRYHDAARADQLAARARAIVLGAFAQQVVQQAMTYGLTSTPQLNDPQFVARLVFDPSARDTPKRRFAYLFPNADTAIVTIRLKPGLSEVEQHRAIGLVRAAVAMPDWRPTLGESYRVTGEPVIVSDLLSTISRSLIVLLIAAVAVMALVLALLMRSGPRLLGLAVALVTIGIVLGGLALTGAPLTMATVGVAPILIGLTVDYAIQRQSRTRPRTLAVAAAATAAGFLVLLLSPVPMIGAFGLVLVAGVLVGLVVSLMLVPAVLALHRARPVPASLAQARELLLHNRASRLLRSRGAGIVRLHPRRVVTVAVVLAVAGWAVESQTAVQTDITRLVPQDLASLSGLRALERATGVGGEIDVLVRGRQVTSPQVVAWMTRYQSRILGHFGYGARRPCGRAEICPAFSLPDLFSSGGARPSAATIDTLLAAVPPYLSQAVITPDRHMATIAFGIRAMPLTRQASVVATMRAALHPPPGVRADLVGLPVLTAQADAAVTSPARRLEMLLAGLVAVALVLLLAFRGDPRRALLPVVPIALATGWSALLLFALRVPLNPMSVTLGALVTAIATEFSVLLAERYRAERSAGHDPPAALERCYRHTGVTVGASGVTALAGFAVLTLSRIAMLRAFGVVTVIDLAVALVGVLLVLPAVLLLAERRMVAPVPRLPRLRREPV